MSKQTNGKPNTAISTRRVINAKQPKIAPVASAARPVNQPSTRRQPPKQTQKKNESDHQWWIDTGKSALKLLPHLMEYLPLLAGFGDYDVKSNSLLAGATNGKIGGMIPIVRNTKSSFIISHREYLGDILSSTEDFDITTFKLNPGMSETFPWLALIAACFEQWRPRGIVFDFATEASEYTNDVGIGYVAIATQYNSYDIPFQDKMSMMNHEFCTRGKTSESFVHPVECARSENVLSDLYTRSGDAEGDIRMYDLGEVSIAVGGQTVAEKVIGELWATYEIEFLKPKLSTTTGSFLNYWLANFLPTDGTPLGTEEIVTETTTSTFVPIIDQAAGKITLPNGLRGIYNLQYYIHKSEVGLNPLILPPVTVFNATSIDGPFDYAPNVGGTDTSAGFFNFTIKVDQDGAGWDLGNLTGTEGDFYIGNLQIFQTPLSKFAKNNILLNRRLKQFKKKKIAKGDENKLIIAKLQQTIEELSNKIVTIENNQPSNNNVRNADRKSVV